MLSSDEALDDCGNVLLNAKLSDEDTPEEVAGVGYGFGVGYAVGTGALLLLGIGLLKLTYEDGRGVTQVPVLQALDTLPND